MPPFPHCPIDGANPSQGGSREFSAPVLEAFCRGKELPYFLSHCFLEWCAALSVNASFVMDDLPFSVDTATLRPKSE